MREPDNSTSVAKAGRQPNVPSAGARLLALAERWLRPADQLDYLIRRLVVPVRMEVGRSASRRPSSHSDGLLSAIPAAIGHYLREEYDLAQPIPSRIVDLVRQLDEQQSGQRV
jgi:hypothetical protein